MPRAPVSPDLTGVDALDAEATVNADLDGAGPLEEPADADADELEPGEDVR